MCCVSILHFLVREIDGILVQVGLLKLALSVDIVNVLAETARVVITPKEKLLDKRASEARNENLVVVVVVCLCAIEDCSRLSYPRDCHSKCERYSCSFSEASIISFAMSL